MSLNRNRGKAAERAVALALDGKRVGTLSGEDVHFDGPFSAEVKSRGAFVACDWMEQAVRNAPPGKTPLGGPRPRQAPRKGLGDSSFE